MILNGWKEIAGHLGRGVRTVQRWELLGLPVRRPNSKLRSAVICTSEDLDARVARCQNGRSLPSEEVDIAYDPATREKLVQLAVNAAIVRRNAIRLKEQIEEIRARAEARIRARSARASEI